MKRINLTDLIFFLDFPEVRPSQRLKLKELLYSNGAATIRELCKMTPEEFHAIPGLTPELKVSILSALFRYGLKVGMTEEEIINYMDEDYLKEHPETNSVDHIIHDVPSKTDVEEVEETPIENEVVEQESAEDPNDKTIEERLLSLERELALNYDPTQFHPVDLEYTFHLNAINELYNQPWWKKLFWSRHKRMMDAICKAMDFHAYRKIAMKSRANSTDRSRSELKKQIADLSAELDNA